MHTYFQGTVGERIKDFLREKKLTQAVLSEKSGVSKATLNRYITDPDSRIPHDVLLKIAKCFGVSTDFLLGTRISCARPSPTRISVICCWICS